jgi:hypothetical protein
MTTTDERATTTAEPVKQRELQEQLAEQTLQNIELRAEIADWEHKWQRCWARLGAEANSRGWCEVYDEIAEELGGIPRETEVSVQLTATVRTRLSTDQVRGVLGGFPGYLPFQLDEAVEITWQTRTQRMTTTTYQQCGCQNLDQRAEFEEYLRELGVLFDSVEIIEACCGWC